MRGFLSDSPKKIYVHVLAHCALQCNALSAFGGEWSCLPSDWMDPANGLPDLVTEVPACLATDLKVQVQVTAMILEELAAFRMRGEILPSLPPALHRYLASKSCRGAIMFGPQQMSDLMGDQLAGHGVVHHLPVAVDIRQPQGGRRHRGSMREREVRPD